MKVRGVPTRTIWLEADGEAVAILDQTRLPHAVETLRLTCLEEAAHAIRAMQVRGAPLIGATAAWGVWLAVRRDASDVALDAACRALVRTRPTAVNLAWALDAVRARLAPLSPPERPDAARREAERICDDDVALNRAIGEHGLALLAEVFERKGPVNVLTHCNAGWLATVDRGTALAPVYAAQEAGIPVHVWVDETRPRNQGAALTAWELAEQGIPHTVVVDNAGGHLMQHGAVDLVLTGTDRTTGRGDVCNKIGTYLKALAARDCGVPFWVAAPSPSIDWTLDDGLAEIPIEERDAEEVTHVAGPDAEGVVRTVRLTPERSPARNVAFDVTPARLVTGLVTERGLCDASAEGLARLFPEARRKATA